ncbi:MAG: hypothetical protein A2020_06215 [Lentisphaerae bacterium GWF2_45_14]|nr:MAG: hypothetical protein A2020_06215 [Lentisphaerae bacterium GWF2_45_14]
MKKVKIGIIGCGKIASCAHVPGLKAIKNVEITGLFDVKKENAERMKKDNLLDAKIFKSAEELLGSGIDGVVIGTPNSTHCPLTLQALEKGVNVLVEKPMAVNLAEADKMIVLAGKKKLYLQVNQSLRFNNIYGKMKQLIDKKTIGDIIHIRCLRASSGSPDKGWSPGAKWFIQKSFGGGIVMDIAVHMADMMGWYAGDIKSVYAVNKIRGKDSEVTDNVNAIVDFENGATGCLELSWTFPAGAGYLEIYGTEGIIRQGFNPSGDIEIAAKSKKFRKIKAGKVKNSYECFILGILGKPQTNPVEVGRKALAICSAIIESGEKKKPIALKVK